MKKTIFMAKLLPVLIFATLYCHTSFSKDDSTDFRREDKIRIKEALRIFEELGDSVWKNRDSTPFAILLVTNDNEYLMNHSDPTEDFKPLGFDSAVGSEIYTRPRQVSSNFLATFPAVNGVSTIVVGIPENTNRSSLEWIITILHEHFHQMQSTHPDYYAGVEALDLAGEDKSGMWMLNYDFPYKDSAVSSQYKILVQSAKKTFLSIDSPDFEYNMKNHLSEREKFKALLNKKDYDYFSFQIWQEGMARYTEFDFAEILRLYYNPSDELTQLNDYVSLDSFYTSKLNKLLMKADSQELNDGERNCFYTLGALEGLILDKVNPDWKDDYFKEMFYVESYFKNNESQNR